MVWDVLFCPDVPVCRCALPVGTQRWAPLRHFEPLRWCVWLWVWSGGDVGWIRCVEVVRVVELKECLRPLCLGSDLPSWIIAVSRRQITGLSGVARHAGGSAVMRRLPEASALRGSRTARALGPGSWGSARYLCDAGSTCTWSGMSCFVRMFRFAAAHCLSARSVGAGGAG